MKASTDHRPNAEAAVIRRARSDDAPALAVLLAALGYPAEVALIERRIAACVASRETVVFVAESGNRIVGALSFHCIPLFHAEGSLGRITSLVVGPDDRRRGIGRLLVGAGEEFARAHGCARVEVTSGDHRPEAHAF